MNATKLWAISVHAQHFGVIKSPDLKAIENLWEIINPAWIVISHAGLPMKLNFEKNLRKIGKKLSMTHAQSQYLGEWLLKWKKKKKEPTKYEYW